MSESPAAKSLLSPSVLPLSVALMLGTALVAFEGLSITAALPDIGADLGNLDRLPWVITGYLLVSGLTIALTGGWVDALGARAIFRLATLGFAGSSLACALAPNLETLIAARFLQGASGGMTIATTGAAVGLAYPSALRSRAYAMASTVWGVVAFGGPVLVAALLTFVGWRAVFHTSVALALVTLTIGWRVFPGPLPESLARPLRQRLTLDLPGIVSIALLSTATLLGLSTLDRWSLPALLLALGAAGFYWRHSKKTGTPVLDRAHFARKPFRDLAIVAGLTMAAGVGVEAYLPLYLRGGRGTSTAIAAGSVLFLTIGWTIASNWVARLYHRIPETRVSTLGAGLLVPGLLLAALGALLSLPIWILFCAFFLLGLGIGATTNACLTLVQQSARPGEIGRATAAHQFIRNMSVTYGTALAGAVMLLAVHLLLGSTEVLEAVLAGVDPSAGDASESSTRVAAAAVAHGFFLSCLVGLVLACFGVAWAKRSEGSTKNESSDSRIPLEEAPEAGI